MTAEVVNLRRARKSAARVKAARKANENAVRHGQPKDVKALEAARVAKARRDLDGHKRDD